MLKAAKRT